MVVIVCVIELYLPSAHSLKDKRRQLKSLLIRLGQAFNVAVAEVDYHDHWQSAKIALVTVSNDTARAEQVLNQAVTWIERERPDLTIVDWQLMPI